MPDFKGKRILVADDDNVVTRLLESRLKESGFEVFCAADGLDALVKIKQHRPDVIILDVMMPEMNGYDVCYQLRFNQDFEAVPIVLLTERDQELDDKLGKRARIEYLSKPLDFPQLLTKLNLLLSR